MQYGVGASRRYACYAAHTATIYAYTSNPLAPPHYPPLAYIPLFTAFGFLRENEAVSSRISSQSNVDWKILMGLSTRYPQPPIPSSFFCSPSSTSERILFPSRYALEFQIGETEIYILYLELIRLPTNDTLAPDIN